MSFNKKLFNALHGEKPRKSRKRPTDQQYWRAAVDIWTEAGLIEIDGAAEVSSSKQGAYIQAWVWVDASVAKGYKGDDE